MEDTSLYSYSTSSTLIPESTSESHKDINADFLAPASTSAPSAILSFTTGSINNTSVLSSSEQALYTITTDAISNSHTKILRGGPTLDDSRSTGNNPIELVAEIKRRDLLPDIVKFSSWPSSKRLKSWMHGASGKSSDYPISFEWNSLTYTWKTNEALQIALYNDLRPSTPIAWFQTASGAPRPNASHRRPRDLLALQPEAEGMLDAVLVSLVVVMQGLRWKDAQYQSVKFTPSTVTGQPLYGA